MDRKERGLIVCGKLRLLLLYVALCVSCLAVSADTLSEDQKQLTSEAEKIQILRQLMENNIKNSLISNEEYNKIKKQLKTQTELLESTKKTDNKHIKDLRKQERQLLYQWRRDQTQSNKSIWIAWRQYGLSTALVNKTRLIWGGGGAVLGFLLGILVMIFSGWGK